MVWKTMRRQIPVLIGCLLMAVGMSWTSSAQGADRHINLQAMSGNIVAGDGTDLYILSFSDTGSFRFPGPLIDVTEGDHVFVHLTNYLPDPDGAGPMTADPVSLVFPGQEGVSNQDPVYEMVGNKATLRSFAKDVMPNQGSVDYDFYATKPGTFYYQSGTYLHKHTEMGLYGGMIVRPSGAANQAYGTPDTAYDREYFMLMSAADSVQHRRVEMGLPYQNTLWHPTFWFINGRSFPDTLAADNASYIPTQPMSSLVGMYPGEKVLFRMVTVDRHAHPFHHHGSHATLIARNATLLQSSTTAGVADLSVERFTETVYPGETQDAIFTWGTADMTATMGWDVTGVDATHPVPVVVPPVQNDPNEALVFGEFYSGSPYLKQKGALPTGHTDINQIGEHYMIFHSHHEHELQNLNEGLGGLATQIAIFPTPTP